MRKIFKQLKIDTDYASLIKNNPDFKRLLWARILSLIGTQMHRFGLPWLVYTLSGSASLMAVNFTVSLIPGLLFGFLGGVITDRHNRKKILFWGDLVAGMITLTYFFLNFLSFPLSTWHLFALTFILSSITALYNPTFDASLPRVISKDDIVNANSLFNVSKSFISLGGPVFAGMIIGFLGPWSNILLNSLSFIVSAYLILLIKSNLDNTEDSNNGSFFVDMKNGFSYVKNHNWVFFGLIITFGLFIATGSVGSLIQYYLIDELHLDGFLFGLSFALFEFLPMLVMGVYAPTLAKKFSYETLILTGSICFALSLIGLGATTIYSIVIVFGMFLNASAVLVIISWNSARQERTPSNLLGKVSGVALTVQSIALPIGGALSSFMVNFISPQLTFIIFGLVCLIISICIIFTPYLEKRPINYLKKTN